MISKLKPYPKYKDSGIEWLGEVPEGWEVIGFKKIMASLVDYRGKTPETKLSGIFLITARNIKNGVIDYSLSQKYVSVVDYPEIMSRGLPKIGDVLFTTEAPLGEVANVDNKEIALAQRIIKFRGISNKVCNYFLKYFMMSYSFQSSLYLYASGSTALGIKAERLCYLFSLLPSIKEQTTIANYLDKQTAKIDKLIKNYQKLIVLSKEKRVALITHCVTKGLDPNVKMKDSGIEWLGEVPEGWEVEKLKNYISTIKGFAFAASDFCDNGISVVKASNIKKNTVISSNVYLPYSYSRTYSQVKLCENDILISTVGSNPNVADSAVGQLALVPNCFNGALLNQNTAILKVFSLNQFYLFYTLLTKSYRDHLDLHAHGTANQSSLNLDDILSYLIQVPSFSEQTTIAKYLDKQTARIDQVIEKAQQAIKLLKEKRTALITAVVTGKVDVGGVI